ncbi:putative enzyme of poly-gamma-glutamate biosynthesis (capsule formation) [Frankia casuarinae]|uniref:Poly-gamma-glutamate synthesis protein n=2 Tax=Frankia casuarinae (strain DSM 45818 / CECT 9043 / HFP020203 / CcI3) TaxID=106370 RepID=Q2JA42_FRACC|nr:MULTISPECIES: CapA family protein [Frankia]ABD11850.1 poly-gamma-glutamate synthesis protein [Frankia casuarinae]ETA00729.1 putative enzyme of poly-gamma-glutamate biosynthesis (capsule formation) [Frankia sp. CcI6]EYT90643.1 putative enzyme of poly-gamma-glutamate biosynthesis (capsule formation) [Frankia casuarinae]KDA41739.1 putative enzyme of poly-gamma-glutamate biosynthesis (capsule formation) [Frankia sp. BMG5.23]KEZ35150.1 putative enzyme of poly-gamma-glutamate biosynthesis (capsul
MHDGVVTLFLCGDVMLGRGVDQILPHPGDPRLSEGYVQDARAYVELAEAVNGPIPRPVEFSWPWGDALPVLDEVRADVRVVNLENSITRCDDFAAGKEVHYRMSPDNLPCLAAGRPDVCVLANNHLLDFGHRGLVETLDALFTAGLRAVGAGRDADEACKPAMVPLGGGRRVLVSSFGLSSSGIPRTWAAAPGRAGIDVIPELSDATAEEVTARVRRAKRPGDLVVASVHWGSNWGYDVDDDQIRFARRLIDGGVDVVHGHSSHHPRPVEVYRDRLVLYGCGDFINDYEGITGYEMYRDDLRLAYFVSAGVSVDPPGATLTGLRMVPLQTRRMRLWRAAPEDAGWLRGVLTRISRGFGTRFDLNAPGVLSLRQP